MTIPNKRYRVANLKLREISSVDWPAQSGATAVLIKSAGGTNMTYTDILKSASAVGRGDPPAHSRDQYEAAMLKRAEELADKQGITPEAASPSQACTAFPAPSSRPSSAT